MKFLIVLLSVCFVFTGMTFADVSKNKHHHRWGVNLIVALDLAHPEIAKSKLAPEEVLIEKAKEQQYYLKLIEVKKTKSSFVVQVAIPRSANKEMYVEFLKKLEFVKGVGEIVK